MKIDASQRCPTCQKEVRLDGPDYFRVNTTFEFEPPLFYCSRECLYQTAQVDPSRWQRTRNVQKMKGKKR